MGPESHSRRSLHGQCRRAHSRKVEPPAERYAGGTQAVRLHGKHRRVRRAGDGVRAAHRGAHQNLWEAVRTGVIFRSDDSYRFLHDRVQEAAYSLIPEELRAETHLRIGMLMASHTPPDKLEEVSFEIANQLNRGAHLIAST